MNSNLDAGESSKYAISRAIGQIEAFCGVVVAGLLTFMIFCLAVYGIVAPLLNPSEKRMTTGHYWIVVAGAVALFTMELFSFSLIFRAIQRSPGKKLIALALRHPTFPIPVRPLVFIWWTTHFVLIALAGHYATPMIRIVEDPTRYQRCVTNFIRFLFALGVSFSTNSYLMLMTASVTHRRGILHAVFRLRAVADALLCADLLLPHQWF